MATACDGAPSPWQWSQATLVTAMRQRLPPLHPRPRLPAVSQNPLLLLDRAARWRRRSGVPPTARSFVPSNDVAMAAVAAPRIARSVPALMAARDRVCARESRRDAVLHTTRLGWKGWREAHSERQGARGDARHGSV